MNEVCVEHGKRLGISQYDSIALSERGAVAGGHVRAALTPQHVRAARHVCMGAPACSS